jgi:hypothetical protein
LLEKQLFGLCQKAASLRAATKVKELASTPKQGELPLLFWVSAIKAKASVASLQQSSFSNHFGFALPDDKEKFSFFKTFMINIKVASLVAALAAAKGKTFPRSKSCFAAKVFWQKFVLFEGNSLP